METRASHLAVGAFVLVLLVGVVGFVAWVARYTGQETYAYYDILYSGDVTGLNIDGPVRYRGIPVGRVVSMVIDPNDFDQIRITVEVLQGTPLREDSYATIEPQGITGVLYVLLTGGTEGAEPLPETTKEPYPIIPSRPGKLAQIFESVPETLAKATLLLEQVTLLFNEENRTAIGNTLQNLEAITNEISDSSDEVKGLMASAQDAINQLNAMSASIQQLADNLNGKSDTIGNDVSAAVTDLRTMAQSFNSVAEQLDLLLADNRQPLNDFADQGLYEATQMLTEIRLLVAQLHRIAAQFERDPARFLFGDRQQGFETQP
jgi:phospholipid/cholesterol/gamma-HCH transport system substrate-binding protein